MYFQPSLILIIIPQLKFRRPHSGGATATPCAQNLRIFPLSRVKCAPHRQLPSRIATSDQPTSLVRINRAFTEHRGAVLLLQRCPRRVDIFATAETTECSRVSENCFYWLLFH